MFLAALLLQAVDQLPETKAIRPYAGAYVSPMALDQLTACASDRLDNLGKIRAYKTMDGTVIDFRFGLMASVENPSIRFTIKDTGEARRITATYAHPVSGKDVRHWFRIFVKKCGGEVT